MRLARLVSTAPRVLSHASPSSTIPRRHASSGSQTPTSYGTSFGFHNISYRNGVLLVMATLGSCLACWLDNVGPRSPTRWLIMPNPSRDIAQLLALMKALRDPDAGCPWDLQQTFATIAPYTIEEAFEVADAVTRGDLDDLKDELGDLLLQVAFHAQMAQERGAFDFGDVVEAITAKLIRRHPHVFGDAKNLSPDAVKELWNEIKEAERAAAAAAANGAAPRPAESALAKVPAGMPALIRAERLSRKAAAVGFDWESADQVLDKIDEELAEVREALAQGTADEIEGEIGDLLFAAVNLARQAGVDPEAALRRTNAKFERRFRWMEQSLAEEGQTPQAVGLERLETLWVAAKHDEAHPGDTGAPVTPADARADSD